MIEENSWITYPNIKISVFWSYLRQNIIDYSILITGEIFLPIISRVIVCGRYRYYFTRGWGSIRILYKYLQTKYWNNNPKSANHNRSRRQILWHLSQFSKKIRYDISWDLSASRQCPWNIKPYLLFLKKRQNLILSSAANYRWRFKG